ncbi:TRAP transporter small permease [Corynebacterium breve]|uniref:TRAP transporter small permease n=1 Tax=Corynebacterium breve TaxID=3049799 RepID=A0ABY8VB17_9CORY|nr:TRAP transporter small permease [Corynebacterium breve]WIM66855.1 TRAP transporter small permease [Corynebacterium breve]
MAVLKKALLSTLGVISVVLFAILVATTSWQVITRQILHTPSTWSEEFAKICFVWLTFLGSAFLFGERGHIAVDFLARKLSEGGQRAMQLFVQLMILVFAGVGMTWGGILAAKVAWHQNLTALPFAIGWVYIVIPIAGVCIAIFALIDIVQVATGAQPAYLEIEDPDAPRNHQELEEAAQGEIGTPDKVATATDSKEVK